MVNYIKKCPECGGSDLILHEDRGETVCRSCGFVIEDRMVDFTQEWREFESDQADKRRRTGAPITYSVDYNEPVAIKNNENIEIVKIGKFLIRKIRQNRSLTFLYLYDRMYPPREDRDSRGPAP